MAEPPPKKSPVSTSAKNEQVAALISTDDSSLSRDAQAKVGSQLRSMYDDVEKESVPERFAHLIRELDAQAEVERSEPAAPVAATPPASKVSETSPTSKVTEPKPQPSLWGRLLALFGFGRSQ